MFCPDIMVTYTYKWVLKNTLIPIHVLNVNLKNKNLISIGTFDSVYIQCYRYAFIIYMTVGNNGSRVLFEECNFQNQRSMDFIIGEISKVYHLKDSYMKVLFPFIKIYIL